MRMHAIVVVVIASAMGLIGQENNARRNHLRIPNGFDLSAAMVLLFDNYNPSTHSSIYDVPQSTVLDLQGSSFQRGDKIVVRPFWVATTSEDGKRKVVLLTYAVPDSRGYEPAFPGDEPFTCHMCVPLIGAAFFVQDGDEWLLESSRAAVSRVGSWGQPPNDIRIVHVGPRRIGIEITYGGVAQGQTTTAKWLLVPWNGKVNEATFRIVADDDNGACGGEEDNLPCYANSKTLEFLPGTNSDYCDIVLKLSGTDMTDTQPIKTRKIKGFERLEFADGVYKTVRKTGDVTSVERAIQERDQALKHQQ